jgi:hypothetical protein
MTRPVTLLTCLLFAFSLVEFTAVANADTGAPQGSYTVSGTGPSGGAPYTGVVAVQRVGDVFSVTWTVAGVTSTGTGIFKNGHLAISYSSPNAAGGVALYSAKVDGGWEGIWTYVGSQQTGTEDWTPQ